MGKKGISLNYKNCITKNYCIAYDCDKCDTGTKKEKVIYTKDLDNQDRYYSNFLGFDTLNEMTKYCNDIRNNNVYQVINKSIVKPYFDIDKCSITDIQLRDLILHMITGFKLQFQVEIQYEDFIVETTKLYPYQSIHIVIDNVKVNMSDLKLFCITFLMENKIVDLDMSVYTKNRQFKLYGMWKLKKGVDNKLLNHKDCKNIDFKNRIITNTNKCKSISICNEIKIKLNKIQVDKQKNINKQIKNTKEEKAIEYIDTDLIYQLLNDLNNDFYMNNRDWTNITKYIIKELNFESITIKNELLDNWCRISSVKSNGKYSEYENKKYINELDNEKMKYIDYWGIYTFNKFINKYLTGKYRLIINTKKITTEMINYIHISSKFSVEHIENCIENTNLYENLLVELSETDYWDINNQYLIYNKTLYNYNEIEYQRRLEYVDYELEYDNTITDINDMKIYNKQLVEKSVDTLIYKAKWGTGKSHYGLTEIIKELDNNDTDCSMVIITENNSLNSELLNKYRKYGFKSHMESNWEESNRLIVSLESSIKMGKTDWDLVVMDEAETILNQYESEATISNVKIGGGADIDIEDKMYYNYQNLKEMIIGASRLLVMDADIY